MDGGGIFLPFSDLPGRSSEFRAELSVYLQAKLRSGGGDNAEAEPEETDEMEEPSDLSVAQAKKFLDRVSDKVRGTIRVIAEADPSGFTIPPILEALGVDDVSSLRGVWGGITKRVRTVLGDDQAALIWWVEEEGGWRGRVSTMTHRSFRKVLGL